MKAAIIGAGGRVGACAASALQWGGIVSDIVLVDIPQSPVAGECLDLLHGASLLHDQRFTVGTAADAARCDIVIVTAGLKRTPGESRLALIDRNVGLFLGIVRDLKAAGMPPETVLLVVSNPVDILTHLAAREAGLPPGRVLGLGTVLDSCRLSSLTADAIGAAPTQVRALMLGEHGDSMVAAWSCATLGGLPLTSHPCLTSHVRTQLEERARQSGGEVLKMKGGAGWAVAASIHAVVRAILCDERKVLPVSTPQHGAYGVSGVSLSVPTVVGRGGALKVLELELWPREKQGLKASENALRETLSLVKA